MNIQVHNTTRLSPYEAVFGQKPRLVLFLSTNTTHVILEEALEDEGVCIEEGVQVGKRTVWREGTALRERTSGQRKRREETALREMTSGRWKRREETALRERTSGRWKRREETALRERTSERREKIL